MMRLFRWVALLALVHTWSGAAIAGVVLAAVLAERLRRRLPSGPGTAARP